MRPLLEVGGGSRGVGGDWRTIPQWCTQKVSAEEACVRVVKVLRVCLCLTSASLGRELHRLLAAAAAAQRGPGDATRGSAEAGL